MLQNQFFKRNRIHCQIEQRQSQVAKIRSKRSQSVVSIKADSAKFQHRQVFNKNIYTKVDFFNVGLKELQQQHKKQITTSIMILEEEICKIGKLIGDGSLSHYINNYSNHWNLYSQNKQRADVMQGINQILISLSKKIFSKMQMLVLSKVQLTEKVRRLESQLIINRKTYNQPSLKEEKFILVAQQLQKNIRQKNNQLDFFLKKQKLRVEQLKQQIKDKNKMINELTCENKNMLEQRQKQVAHNQMMEFKLKKLKEELQVAHIIKEQNLQDKMKYIMDW